MKVSVINKRTFFLAAVIVSLLVASCKNNKKEVESKAVSVSNGIAEIKFDTTFYDFGNLTQGEAVVYTFKFTNIGTADLVINDAFSSCGCTVPNYSKEPISPGKEGKVEIRFDSSGKSGIQYKSIKLKLNTNRREARLNIKANVVVK